MPIHCQSHYRDIEGSLRRHHPRARAHARRDAQRRHFTVNLTTETSRALCVDTTRAFEHMLGVMPGDTTSLASLPQRHRGFSSWGSLRQRHARARAYARRDGQRCYRWQGSLTFGTSRVACLTPSRGVSSAIAVSTLLQICPSARAYARRDVRRRR